MMEWHNIPTLEWMGAATEVTSLDWLAAEHGCEFVGVKRDDKIEFGSGGSKIRKLDFLLASEPYRSAIGWHGVGAIGSGNLVALGEAAKRLGKSLHAHCFWEDLSPGISENLACISSAPTQLRYYRGRAALVLTNPSLFVRKSYGGLPIIPTGSTSPLATLGMVRAGLELAEQIKSKQLPTPDRVYVAYGSGGTAIGLSIGLGLAKVDTRICAVSAVERVVCNRPLLRCQTKRMLRYMEHLGITDGPVEPVPITLDHSELGAGYGRSTARSLLVCEFLEPKDIRLEAVYTGKAFSRLLRDLDAGITRTPLLWNTARRAGQKVTGSWWNNLPQPLRKKLAGVSEEFRAEMLSSSLRNR